MSIEGTIAWFRNPASGVSAHYVVGRDGRTVQMVPDDWIAWHAGTSAMFPERKPPGEPGVNKFSIGIELVGTERSGFTPPQLDALYALLRRLVTTYNIPPERVVGHCHIAPGRKIDPDGLSRQFPWAECRQACTDAILAHKEKINGDSDGDHRADADGSDGVGDGGRAARRTADGIDDPSQSG
jgi:N-acetyl-anhydromuramyl-L-alanine amidase AmpD